MKRRLQYILISAMALILAAVLLGGAALQPEAAELSEQALHFGVSGMESNQSVSPSKLFEELYGAPPTETEQAYLDGLSGLSLIYNSAIPDSVVSTSYNGNEGTLSVSVQAYSYTAVNGTKVTWIPTQATVGKNTQTFVESNGSYSCQFADMVHSGDFEVKIDFRWVTELSATVADAVITAPYTAGSEALQILKAYEAELAAYEAADAKYQAYVNYLQAVENYENYINVELPAYEAAMQLYEPYRQKYEQYLSDLAAYEAWQHYWDYQEFMTGDVQVKYQAYQNYLNQLKPIKSRLNVLDTLFIKDSHGWELYASLMGGTVDRVVANKNTLIAYKQAFEKYINNAEASTKVLKQLMSEYASLRSASYASEHARLTALYAFYTKNYTELSFHFKQLFEALNYMGNDSAVVMALSSEGKLEHYFQFVGQLYVTQVCLDDAKALNRGMGICGNLLTDVVEPLQLLTDAAASPTGVTMPAVEVPKVEKVEPIERPTFPEIREEPTAPTPVVQKPTEPVVYTKPDISNPPPYAEKPENKPLEPEMDKRLRALAEGVRNGSLLQRESTQKTHTLTFLTSISCPVSINNKKTVTFYSADGKEVLWRDSLEYGTRIIYRGKDTARPSDAQYHYRFLGWVLADGSVPEMTAYSNMSLYAYYQKTPRFYTVTWILDGVKQEVSVEYGTLPTTPFITQKAPDSAYVYTFSGWDKEIVPVTEDVTYTGSMIATPITYTVTWVVDEYTETQVLHYGEMPSFGGSTDKAPDSYRYTFLGWDDTPTAVTRDVTYTARYSKTLLAQDENDRPLEVEHTESTIVVYATRRADLREAAKLAKEQGKALEVRFETFCVTVQSNDLSYLTDSYCREIGITSVETDERGTVYSVEYLSSAGIPLNIAVPATFAPLKNTDGGRMVGYLADGDEWKLIPDEGAHATGAVKLRIRNVFSVNVTSNEPCNLSRFPKFFEEGTKVNLSLIGCEFGYEITGATLYDADGTPFPIEQNVFYMPNENVTLEICISEIIYHVSFVVDGKVIQENTYRLGEEIIVPPENPTKEADESFSYTFAAWSRDVGIAYGDERTLVFEAVFTSTPIGGEFVPDRSLFLTFLTVSIIAFVILAGGTVTLVLLLRRKKRRAKNAEFAALSQGEKSDDVMQNDEVLKP